MHLMSEPVSISCDDRFSYRDGSLSEAMSAIPYPHHSANDAKGPAAGHHLTTDNHFKTLGEALEEANYDKLIARLQADGVVVYHRKLKGPPGKNQGIRAAVPRFVVTQRSFSFGSRKFTCRSTHPSNAAALFRMGDDARLGFNNTIWISLYAES